MPELPSLSLSSGIALFVTAALLLFGVWFFGRLFRKRPDPFPYEAQPALFTKPEQKFLAVLFDAVGDDFLILGKIRLADLIRVRKGTVEWQAAFNKISKKHLDYVLIDPEDCSIRLAIELDDRSHDRPERIARDVFLNRAMAAADVVLARFPTAATYDAKIIRKKLLAAMPPKSG